MDPVVITNEGVVVDLAQLASTRAERRRGLLGRDGYDRIMVFEHTRQVHTIGMRFSIDVAWCDRHGEVLVVRAVPPNRLTGWVRQADAVLEARAGHFALLGVATGDRLRWRSHRPHGTDTTAGHDPRHVGNATGRRGIGHTGHHDRWCADPRRHPDRQSG